MTVRLPKERNFFLGFWIKSLKLSGLLLKTNHTVRVDNGNYLKIKNIFTINAGDPQK